MHRWYRESVIDPNVKMVKLKNTFDECNYKVWWVTKVK